VSIEFLVTSLIVVAAIGCIRRGFAGAFVAGARPAVTER
jgi:hypothetical protein